MDVRKLITTMATPVVQTEKSADKKPKKEPVKTVIPEFLLAEAPPRAKAVLEFYNKLECKVDAMLSESIIKIKSKFGAPFIEELATYLSLDVRQTENEKGYRNIPVLIHRCLLKVRSYTPSTCGVCLENYCVEKDTVPVFTCWMCFQGSHDCEGVAKIFSTLYTITQSLTGFNWTCHSCTEKGSLDLMSRIPVIPGKDDPVIVSDEISDPPGTAAEVVAKEVSTGESSGISCSFLAEGYCRHGISGKKEVDGKTCRFTHRKVCRKFKLYGSHSRHGCKLGAKCSKLHPKLCEGSQRRIKERQCLNSDCPHLHLKGTRRKEENPERRERQEIARPTRKTSSHDHRERSVHAENLPLSRSPLRPVTQQNPEHLQSGFLSIVLKEVRNAREESLRQADRMEEILSQLGPTHNESILHSQLAHHVQVHQPVQYTLPSGVTMTQGAHRQLPTQILSSQRSSY